jgi:hypothetical protein
MSKIVRIVLVGICAVLLVLMVAYYRQWAWATSLWPFEDTAPTSYIFLSSILGAAAASTLWAIATRTYGVLAGVGLDYVAILVPVSVHAFLLGQASGSQVLINYAVICALGALFGVWLLWWALRIPIDRTIPMPRAVRWSFVVFISALLVVGTRLLLRQPNILPWTISSDMAVSVGWMFYGAAVYFGYSLLRPSWNNAASQLAGFLAYDLILIVPLLQALPTVAPEHRRSLYLYLAIITYSGVLATYYLFLHPQTRVWGRRPTIADGESELAAGRAVAAAS